MWLSLQWNLFKAVCCGKQRISPPWQIVVAMSLSGVRGAVTLAGVLTLPLLMPDGTPLPARQLVIFLAASVILVSLLLASVALPYLLRGLELPEKSSYDKEEDFARRVSAQAALEAVERLRQRLVEDSANAERYNEAAHQVSQLYQRKLGAVDLANVDPQETKVFEQVVRRFRQVGLAAERDELFRLAREHNISDELLQRMVRNLDLIEARRRS